MTSFGCMVEVDAASAPFSSVAEGDINSNMHKAAVALKLSNREWLDPSGNLVSHERIVRVSIELVFPDWLASLPEGWLQRWNRV